MKRVVIVLNVYSKTNKNVVMATSKASKNRSLSFAGCDIRLSVLVWP